LRHKHVLCRDVALLLLLLLLLHLPLLPLLLLILLLNLVARYPAKLDSPHHITELPNGREEGLLIQLHIHHSRPIIKPQSCPRFLVLHHHPQAPHLLHVPAAQDEPASGRAGVNAPFPSFSFDLLSPLLILCERKAKELFDEKTSGRRR